MKLTKVFNPKEFSMKKTIIAISMLMSVSAMAQVAQDSSGGVGAAGSFSAPTNTVSNLGWATGQAFNEMEFEPSLYLSAPTLTTMIASYRDSELNKKIAAAREDAQAFVASGGEIVGAQLVAAVKVTRELTNTNKSDMALATEIVAITAQ
jgi:uncharacterized protein (TIGR02448 family)